MTRITFPEPKYWVSQWLSDLALGLPRNNSNRADIADLAHSLVLNDDHRDLVGEILLAAARNTPDLTALAAAETNYYWWFRMPPNDIRRDNLLELFRGGVLSSVLSVDEPESNQWPINAGGVNTCRTEEEILEILHTRNPNVKFEAIDSGDALNLDVRATLIDWGSRDRERFQSGVYRTVAFRRYDSESPAVTVDTESGDIEWTELRAAPPWTFLNSALFSGWEDRVCRAYDNILGEYRDSIRHRLHADEDRIRLEEENERAARRSEATQRYRAFQRQLETTNHDVITPLPFVPHGLRASRNWGIEVETGAGRDLTGVPKGWEAKGDGSLESSYGGSERWVDPSECYYANEHDIELQTLSGTRDSNETGEESPLIEFISSNYRNPMECYDCGWIYVDGYDDDDCVELVSPILTSMHSRGLEQITTDLADTPWNDSAGVHVHVEARDLTVQQVRNLILNYDLIEPLIEYSYQRETRGYCARRSATELLHIVRQIDDNPRIDHQTLHKGDRYVTVNLHSLSYHGTVEFRAMGPVYSYDTLIRWAMFCREMVNVAKNGATPRDFGKVRTMDDLLAIFAKFGEEYNLAVSLEAANAAAEAELVEV